MKLTADYHTHTVYSDGKNTLMENFMQAKKVGLSAIGCTEHGFSHVFFGLRRKKLPQYIRELRAAEAETGVKGLLGLENNLRGMSGLCDYTEKDLELFDLYVMGIHVLVDFEKMRDSKLGLGSLMRTKLHARPSKSLVKFTTKAYINAIKRNPIDVLAHINYCCFSDPVEVAKACRIPVMGCGGVRSARDVIEMMMAGATAVQVGAANLVNPYASKEIVEALPGEMQRLGIERLSDIIGIA